jgi:hypothetical protein
MKLLLLAIAAEVAFLLSGCATQSADSKANVQSAVTAVISGALAYSQGNTSVAAVDGIQGAAYLIRSLQSTPNAAVPAAVTAQVTTGGASPQLAETVASAILVAVHNGKTPDAANEVIAKALDKAAAKPAAPSAQSAALHTYASTLHRRQITPAEYSTLVDGAKIVWTR